MQNNTYTVSQINKYIGNMFAADYLLNRVSVKGEVGTCTYQASGHIYFSLKDENGQLQGAMWRSKRQTGLKFPLKTGMQIIVTGRIEVYEPQGRYQIIAEKIEQDGVGNIYEQFEQLKKKLEAEGMFDPQYKRPIPTHIKTLGVVTAPTGAAVRDIINISKRRNPGIQIILYPATVQGAGAPPEIIEGIRALEDYGVDCMIVGRGGGSMEDLWCFNDEGVAQAIFNSTVPVISAVGHETDFTIADFVADLRAPTPSAAAELAVFNVSLWENSLKEYDRHLANLMRSKILKKKNDLSHYRDKLRLASPESLLHAKRNRLSVLEEKLNDRMQAKLTACKNRLALEAGKLHAVSPLNKLGGGYAYVTAGTGALKSVEDVQAGDVITVSLTDGSVTASVTDTRKEFLIHE